MCSAQRGLWCCHGDRHLCIRHVALGLRVSENAAHKHVFKLLAPVQRGGSGLSGHGKERQRRGFFLSAATETQLLIYGVSVSWAGHVLPERSATGGREGEGRSRERKRMSTRERRGFAYTHPAVRSHPH